MGTDRHSVHSTQYSVRRLIHAAACVVSLSAGAQLCYAKEPYAEFLRALQQRGYGEQALLYLDQISSRPDLPPELKRDLDLERAKSLRIAAAETSDADQRQNRLAEAKRLTEQFIAANPQHPAAAAAYLDEAEETLRRGQNSLAVMRFSRDVAAREQAAAEARTTFTAAGEQFDAALAKLKERLDALPKELDPAAKGSSNPRADIEFSRARGQLSRAMCYYFLAQTYAEPKDADRQKLLKRASEALDAVYQAQRSSQLGLVAHLWHGKALEELGDPQTAQDFYDEVLVAAPEGPDADPELAPLYGQAQLFFFRGQAAADTDPKTLIKDGEDWLTSHKRWVATPPYQGIALEVAKARLAAAEKLRPGSEKTRLLREALTSLAAIGKIDSEYRSEALALRRQVIGSQVEGTSLSFEEFLALGDEAASQQDWAAAHKAYKDAGDLAAKANDPPRQETAKQRLAQLLYRQAVVLYSSGDMEKVLTAAGEIAGAYAKYPVAEDASALAVAAALRLYSEAQPDAREAPLARLQTIVNFAIKTWPTKPVADDSRMALAQVSLIRGEYDQALTHLAGVNKDSKSYATSLQILGQIRWKQYLDGKKAATAGDRQDELQKLRTEAVSHLTASAARQRAAWQAGSDPLPAALFDTQLLLGEIHLEAGETKAAAAIFSALIQAVQAQKPESADLKVQRAFVGAVRAAIAAGNPLEAAEAVLSLAGICRDEAQPNGVLTELARLVNAEVIKAQAATSGVEFGAAAPAPTSALTTQLVEKFSQLLAALAGRQELSVEQMNYVGNACFSLQQNDKARAIYERSLKKIETDPAAKAAAGKAETLIRSRLVGLLRGEGKLDEAQKQVDALIAAHPTALEPLMEKGYILQNLAERDPRRWDACVAHWTELRLRLGRSKSRPPEYYEVLYNAALALVRQARQANNKEKALQAEQMLKSTLTLAPKLSGPEMVAKYNALLAVAVSFRTTAQAKQ